MNTMTHETIIANPILIKEMCINHIGIQDSEQRTIKSGQDIEIVYSN